MNPLDFVPKTVLGVGLMFLLTTNLYFGLENGKLKIEVSRKATALAEAKQEHAQQVAQAQTTLASTSAKYRKSEQYLQAKLNSERKITDEKVAMATTERDALKLRLSQGGALFASSVSGSAAAPGVKAVAVRGPEPEFPVPVGELVDEAFRADQIRLELIGCYKVYEAARAATN